MDYCTKVFVTENIRLDLFTDTAFRVRISSLEGEAFPPQYDIPFAVGKTTPWKPVAYTTDTKDSSMLAVITKSLRIYVRKENGTFLVERADGKRLYPEAAPKYGMFLNHCIVFDSASFHGEPSLCSRFSHWFYSEGSGLYDVHLAEDALFDTYFIYGESYRSGYAQFNELVGAEPLLARKGYGYYQTQHLASEGTQARLMRVAELLREHDIPCDTLILDFEWGDGGSDDVPWGSRLEWRESYRSPLSPKEMIAKLKEMHYDVMVILHNVPAYEGRSDEGWVCYEYPEDVWWEKMQSLLADGVAGTWQDTRQTDVSNARIYRGLEERTGRRVRMLCNYDVYRDSSWTKECVMIPFKQRIGGRRTPFSWTGDMSLEKWSELAFQVQAIVGDQGALKGISYLTNDASRLGERALAMRGDQFLAFNSVARSHNHKPWQRSESPEEFAERIAINKEKGETRRQTEEELLGLARPDPVREENARRYLKLRYRLFPYLYSAARETYDTGLPMTRPLMVAFEGDENCNAGQYPKEYMFGDSLLVCPVLSPESKMKAYFPKGEWIGFFDGKCYPGWCERELDVSDASVLPLFVKSGSVLPMRTPCSYLDEADEVLELHIFGEGESTFILYEDDGDSLGYRSGEYAFTRIRSSVKENEVCLTIGAAEGDYRGKLAERKIKAVWHGRETMPQAAPSDVTLRMEDGLVAEFTMNTEKEREILLSF